eukprot:CAMPEP_0173171436 /NCGR_PEP_ID=MMETSP1141-20130122/1764_1 /TAXON_ID=483371 /ORGANISM="non described non described, Strain CCMP2298" /LENGTH=51 /DNA_ID=CAMNT_0014093385 /DNA_START=97 /DNA_END=249 /DNA_ORIENTATION=+
MIADSEQGTKSPSQSSLPEMRLSKSPSSKSGKPPLISTNSEASLSTLPAVT